MSARVVQSRSRISVLGDHVHPQFVWANFGVMFFLNPTDFNNIDISIYGDHDDKNKATTTYSSSFSSCKSP